MTKNIILVMDLGKLKDSIMGLNAVICTHFMHACAECLDHHGHADKISFSKTNLFKVD